MKILHSIWPKLGFKRYFWIQKQKIIIYVKSFMKIFISFLFWIIKIEIMIKSHRISLKYIKIKKTESLILIFF